MKFKSGDQVRMFTSYGYYIYGEVTIVKDSLVKVLWGGDTDYNYDYYNESDLELITEEDLKENDSQS